MRSEHDININNGELLDEVHEWVKHDKSRVCPVPLDSIVQVETWTKHNHITYLARDLNWSAIKYYKVIEPKK
jgi:hypothetical protein